MKYRPLKLKWSSRALANGVEEIEDLEMRTGQQLEQEFVKMEKESSGRGVALVCAVVVAVLLCILLVCRGIVGGNCDRILGISQSHRRQRKKLSGSHIL